jgi:predicted acylesterase/phospholipase RssA
MGERDLALVLSGGGMNGLLLELGFLSRLRRDPLWARVGWIYGTSAGALSGVMAVLDRLDELEQFVLELRPEETFRPNRLWQLPFNGLHDYALPETIAERLSPIEELARAMTTAPIELVVCVTDMTDGDVDERHAFERTYSSRTTDPDLMSRAVLASAAISALVLPLKVGDVIGTDGGWVRNFPLGHAYDNPDVGEIIGFRYVPRVPKGAGENLPRLRRRLEPFRAVPPVRALIGELRAAEERQERGEPPHLADMIVRLMRVTVARNTELEVRSAEQRDASVRELAALRDEVLESVRRSALPWRRRSAVAEVSRQFSQARFPFRHDRALPLTIVRGDPGDVALDPGFRAGLDWPVETKRALVALGRELTDAALAERPGKDEESSKR